MDGQKINNAVEAAGLAPGQDDKAALRAEIDKALNASSLPRMVRAILACLGGAVPLAGGVISATGSAWSEAEQNKLNQTLLAWLKIQERDFDEMGRTLSDVAARLNFHEERVEQRVRSPEYLSLVRKCFRDWGASDSEEKRTFIRNLLANAAASSLCSDDTIRMFIDWIDRYSEAHFKIIREVYQQKGVTRAEMWEKLHGEDVREDSAEADLFKLLIQDLSMGHVIRQHREKDYAGNYLKVNPQRNRRATTSRRMTSAFDGEKEYELTELGAQFVHYTMNELVLKIEGSSTEGPHDQESAASHLARN